MINSYESGIKALVKEIDRLRDALNTIRRSPLPKPGEEQLWIRSAIKTADNALIR